MRSRSGFIAVAFVVLITCGLVGCGSDKPSTPDPGENPNWPDSLGLPAPDARALAAVADRLAQLRAADGITAARQTILQELAAGWPGVASARLGADSTTITLRFPGGADAVIITDENALGPLPPGIPPQSPRQGPRATTRRFAGLLHPRIICGDIVAPPTRAVHLVNMAGASNPETRQYTAILRQYLLDHGWTDEEVQISQRADYDDRSFTPETLFDQQGYGLVFMIGHGGFRWDASGQEHFILQGFRGGAWEDGYQPYVSQERYNQYRAWYRTGEMVTGRSWSEETQDYVAEIYIRDDLLAAEMHLEQGAMVNFISCNSIQLADELAGIGAGSILGWDGSVNGHDGLQSSVALIDGLSREGGPRTDAATLDWMHEQGLGYSTGHAGEQAVLRLGGDERNFYLPVDAALTADPDCLPAGAERIEVELSYPDCPELNRAFTVFTGGTADLTGLIPVGAELRFNVKDGAGNTLAGHWAPLDLDRLANVIDLCPCTGVVHLEAGQLPIDGPYTATVLDLDMTWPGDPTVPPAFASLNLPALSIPDLLPGAVAMSATLRNANGERLGTTTFQVTTRCGENTAMTCFGWLDLRSTGWPNDTEEIWVQPVGGEPSVPPRAVLSPGGGAGLYSFAVGQSVTLEAVARNAVGVELARATTTAEVGCGPTLVQLMFDEYGITLTAAPSHVPPDGAQTASVTASVRRWQEGDLEEPTGAPVVGKEITFDTDHGFFVGPASGITNSEGRVSVSVASNEVGIATIRAFNVSDGIAAARPARVNFGVGLRVILDGRQADYQGETNYEGRYVTVRCTARALERNGQLINVPNCDGATGWRIENTGLASVGDTLTFEFRPCQPCGTPPSSAGPAWLHLLYGTGYERQITVPVIGLHDPLTATVRASIVLQDPGGAMTSGK